MSNTHRYVGRLVAVVTFVVAAACSNSEPPANDQPATNCAARCTTVLSTCGGDTATCTQLCTTLTEGTLTCLEGTHCDAMATSTCFGSSNGTGGAGGGAFGTAGSGGAPGTMFGAGGSDDTTGIGGTQGTGMAQCSGDAQCQTTIMCPCGDGTSTTAQSGDCVVGQCFHDGDAAACSNACLTHSAP